MIQTYGLDEAGFRGERFANHPRDLKGANDVLAHHAARRSSKRSTASTSRPARTSSRPTPSTPQAISFADYGLAAISSTRSTSPRREVCAARGRRRYATTRPARASWPAPWARRTAPPRSRPTSNDPGCAAMTFDELRRRVLRAGARPRRRRRRHPARRDDVRHAEPEGRAVRHREVLRRSRHHAAGDGLDHHLPTGSGRTLSGQTVEACWNSISHAPLLGVGINCALGAEGDAAARRGAVAARADL